MSNDRERLVEIINSMPTYIDSLNACELADSILADGWHTTDQLDDEFLRLEKKHWKSSLLEEVRGMKKKENKSDKFSSNPDICFGKYYYNQALSDIERLLSED